ncbi:MFS transporter [Hydrogenophaga pseudoflava]|uniref:MFS transporter n=1 Tax=Hydrogenophaga pseudoflava TaxID=47421 RepID=UPI0027E426D5|nr:MFS transporter [Hydrogenophaga pseudoflava]MDQ7744932.1 MFS transporter [Hydrogenophaga pseudoflava]
MSHPRSDSRPASALWALMTGNFVIGTGVMAVPGTLPDISHSLGVSIPQAGQLITAGAIMMGLGAPLFASLVAGWDRRRLLTLSLLWYALLMGLSALAPSYLSLLPLRVLAVVAPAVFTPQAAACIGLLVPEAQRGRAIAFVFLGWSVASVMGMPLSAWIGGVLGWRWAFALVALLAVVSAAWVWRAMPDGVRPAALSREAWGRTLGSAPLMLALGVTLLSSFGQFTLFSYFAPYLQQTLSAGAAALSLLFLWFGAFGLLGNIALTRWVDRLGAPRAVLTALLLMAVSLALWPAGRAGLVAQALVMVPWALGCFASNSAQQARLVHLSPVLAPASVALNTSAMYAGQGLGAALGGALIAQGHMLQLHWVGLALMLLAIGVSQRAAKVQSRPA